MIIILYISELILNLNLIVGASSSLDSQIKLWNLESGTEIRTINAGPGSIFFLF